MTDRIQVEVSAVNAMITSAIHSLKQCSVGLIAGVILCGLLLSCASTPSPPVAAPALPSSITYVATDPTLARILHTELIVAHNDLSLAGTKLKLEVHLENRSNTAMDLYAQTFFQDASGRRLDDQTPRTLVRVPLHGTAIYNAVSLSDAAERAEVHLSYLRTEQVRGAPN